MRVHIDYRQVSKENYFRFKESHPLSTISFLEFENIIYTFNYTFRDYLLETGEVQKLPYGLGEFGISKKKVNKKNFIDKNGLEHIILPIDWKETKKRGKRIYNFNYHTDGFRFKWKWFIKTARFSNSDIRVFMPSRVSSRLITHYLTQPNSNYKDLYKEWELFKR